MSNSYEQAIYSLNDTDFDFETIDEAIHCYSDDEGVTEGIITIYCGEKQTLKASDFASFDSVGMMVNNAYDKYQEHSDSYLIDVTTNQEKELEKEIKKVIDSWADKYDNHPKFCGVKNVKEYNLAFSIVDDDVEYYDLNGDKND